MISQKTSQPGLHRMILREGAAKVPRIEVDVLCMSVARPYSTAGRQVTGNWHVWHASPPAALACSQLTRQTTAVWPKPRRHRARSGQEAGCSQWPDHTWRDHTGHAV